jgi:serine/threonine protein kinase
VTDRIGDYEIVRTLGQGAFGHTFLARHLTTGREVAIKLLDTRGRVDHKASELFKREADVLRAVRHHGIPEIFETFEREWLGVPAAFLAMEYIEGTSLAKIIDEKRTLSESDVTHVFLELLGVLDYLHSRVPPILHRDIKPSNIIVRPNGFPALVDFGSVRRVFMTAEETGSTVAGTYGYMPYEQYMGQASPASDLYALGATFLHLLTGRAPREFMTEEGRLQAPDSLPVEPRLRGVIARLLRPSPAERFASARDVRYALTAVTSAVQRAGENKGLVKNSKTVERLLAMPATPRSITGDTRDLMREAAPSTFRLMYASEKPDDQVSVLSVASLLFFTTITAGILPFVFWNIASIRRRRLKRFFRFGLPASAKVIKSELQETAFDEKLSRVTYEFTVDGVTRRDSDAILPAIADRWSAGDDIPILYLPDRDYDSVIIAVE